jgi:hypothetical protein
MFFSSFFLSFFFFANFVPSWLIWNRRSPPSLMLRTWYSIAHLRVGLVWAETRQVENEDEHEHELLAASGGKVSPNR